jgi:hypothetical protein
MSARTCVAVLLTGLLAAASVPSAAAADATASDGTNVLTLRASMTRARDGGRRAALRLRFDVARVDGGRVLGFSGIRFDLPAGARFFPRAVPQCRQSVLSRDDVVDVARCPRRSRVASGVAHIDARPLLAVPVVADVTLFNGLAEWGNDDERFSRPRPALLLSGQALGVQVLFVATFERGGRRVLVDLGEPLASPDPFTITGLDLRFGRAGTRRRPYLRAPSRCSGSWAFSAAYLFASPLVARERVSCQASG